MNDPCLIITGMHRSHTSLLTECLYKSGLHLGDHLLEASKYNAQGHFEHQEILELHEGLMNEYQLRSKWHGIRESNRKKVKFNERQTQIAKTIINNLSASSDTYGWKDPRACLFLNEWHRIIPNAKYLFIIRHPQHCTESLLRRSHSKRKWKTGPLLSYALLNLWKAYNKGILEFINSNIQNCALVNSAHFQVPQLLNEKLNHQLIEKWSMPINPIDVSLSYNPQLVTSRSSSWSVNYVYQLRKDVQTLYNQLLELSI